MALRERALSAKSQRTGVKMPQVLADLHGDLCQLVEQLISCHRFQGYEESEEGVEVSYTEAGEAKNLRCKLLVGADGYFSAVRQQCLQDGPPEFAVSPARIYAISRHYHVHGPSHRMGGMRLS